MRSEIENEKLKIEKARIFNFQFSIFNLSRTEEAR